MLRNVGYITIRRKLEKNARLAFLQFFRYLREANPNLANINLSIQIVSSEGRFVKAKSSQVEAFA